MVDWTLTRVFLPVQGELVLLSLSYGLLFTSYTVGSYFKNSSTPQGDRQFRNCCSKNKALFTKNSPTLPVYKAMCMHGASPLKYMH